MTALFDALMAVSAVVTALSALGLTGYVRAARNDAKQAINVLLGASEQTEGLVHEVERNSEHRLRCESKEGRD
ncbi:hypothetical protein [Haloarchaeobius sp. HRN-SO-5]|uniref:hypothetical protein n=1 Tax=Haloarchaeobius sp. HRN-SO-5 TaxID=3446118 RepID=UPI003EC064EB